MDSFLKPTIFCSTRFSSDLSILSQLLLSAEVPFLPPLQRRRKNVEEREGKEMEVELVLASSDGSVPF